VLTSSTIDGASGLFALRASLQGLTASSGMPCIVWLMAAMTAMAACGKTKDPIDQQGRTVGARCILGHGMGQGQQARHALLLKRRDIKGEV